MDRQTLRDWVHRFNAAGPEGLFDHWTARSRVCRPSNWLSLPRSSRRGPTARSTASCAGGGPTSSASSPRNSASTITNAMSESCSRSSAFPTSAQGHATPRKTNGSSSFQKNFPRALSAHLNGLPATTPVEIRFQDEARIGQKNGLVRQWARRGTRPRQPADQDNAYLFGAICPARGVGAALALPYADTDMMQLHLDEISRNVGRPRRAAARLRRMAYHRQARGPGQHHPDLLAFPRAPN